MPSPWEPCVLLASSTFSTSTSGTGPVVDAGGWQTISVNLAVTTGTPTAGSVTTFRVWLQGQIGGVWSDLTMDLASKSFIGASNFTASAGVTTMTGAGTQSTSLVSEVVGQSSVVSFYGLVSCPPPLIRLAYNLVTTGNGFVTFSASGVLSQQVSS